MKDNVYLTGLQVARVLGLKMDEFLEMNADGAFIMPAGRDSSGRPVWHAQSISDWVLQRVSDVKESTEKEPMPLVYVAGPYRADTREGIELNIQSARAVAVMAAKKGWAVICPHLNTAHMNELAPDLGDQFWLDATMEMMRRCDAVVLVQGWSESSGTREELDEAHRLEITVYECIDDLENAVSFISRR